ncbi:MAG: NAD-dependent epimerase/dehydratase family protein [Proteobacteria bacterium]|jgi:GDPmannose 4,6-dehydratase|nr:NAD-dependent epimerase/dehydratase family protein [Pseudomonadota bacterium]
MQRALIIGHSGQDGRYLSSLLAGEGFEVFGLSSRSQLGLQLGDEFWNISDPDFIQQVINYCRPDQVYFLAAKQNSSQDDLGDEVRLFEASMEVNSLAIFNVLSAVNAYSSETKVFYAASSHIFGSPSSAIQNEETPFDPVCTYGITKLAGVQACRYFRDKYGVFVCVGIMYNHESPLKGDAFVSQRIVQSAVNIKLQKQSKLILGDLSAEVDWGYAGDYVKAMYGVMSLDEGDDYIISSGELHTVEDLVSVAFGYLDLEWRLYVAVDEGHLSKIRRRSLQGDNTKIRASIGWLPTVSFEEMVQYMVDSYLSMHEKEL